jgi:hypothetical protein
MYFNFDMDGTIVNLYGVENWLPKLIASDSTPYRDAKPLINMARLAKALHKAQRNGHKIAVIAWLSKNGSPEYNKAVADEKVAWLKKHLPSVVWDKIIIVEYGTPKRELNDGILFDDEEPNRKNWGIGAYEPNEMFEVLARA